MCNHVCHRTPVEKFPYMLNYFGKYLIGEKFVGEKFPQLLKISSIFPDEKFQTSVIFPDEKIRHIPFKYLPILSVKTNKQTAGCRSYSYLILVVL